MKIFLSSYKFGDKPEIFFGMLDDGDRVAIIANAGDGHDPVTRAEKVEEEIMFFDSQDIEAEELDLRDYFERSELLSEKLEEFDAVWVRGGNSFLLRSAMEKSGFASILPEKLKDDSLVYGGYSAGACVLGPTLMGIDLCDDVSVVQEVYGEEVVWDGLGIVPFTIAPHYDSDHPESDLIDEVINYYYENDIEHIKLRDGETFFIDE